MYRAVAVVMWLGATAAASPAVELHLDTSHPPIVEAEVIGAPPPAATDLTMFATAAPDKRVQATRVRSFAEVAPPITIAFVIPGSAFALGNTTYETDPNVQYQGVLHGLERAIDELAIPKRVPAGSQFSIITYATGAIVRVPLTPIAELRGSSFGSEADYKGEKGVDLSSGVEQAVRVLEEASTPVKLLVVLNDDVESDRAQSVRTLGALKTRLGRDGISATGLVWGYDRDTDLATLIPQTWTVNSIDGLSVELGRAIDRVTSGFYATFDVSSLPVWTGKPSELQIETAGSTTGSGVLGGSKVTATVELPVRPPSRSRAWLAVAGALALLAIVGAFAVAASARARRGTARSSRR